MKLTWKKKLASILIALRVGFFLAVRELKRGNKWATGLIVVVMILTFLNLVVVSGILLGLIGGATSAVRDHYTSDVLITSFKNQSYIQQSQRIVAFLKAQDEVEAFSPRYVEGIRVEANYKESHKANETVNSAGGLLAGIDPAAEDAVTDLRSKIVEGSYLTPYDFDKIVVGAYLLEKYLPIDSPGLQTLRNVGVGSKVRLKIGNLSREVIIKGVTQSKVDEIDLRIFMPEAQMRTLIGRSDLNVDEIAIKLKDPYFASELVSRLEAQGFGDFARIRTWQDAQPKFLQDIQETFGMLGNIIGSIGLIVASITIFIVIFVNAITRRRYIGILKGIGINSIAIEFSYILQALFYAGIGMIIGSVVIFTFLKPYIAANPIDFPFSDGILVATAAGTFWRALALFVATLIAGYIPARIVVKQNTLDAILGR